MIYHGILTKVMKKRMMKRILHCMHDQMIMLLNFKKEYIKKTYIMLSFLINSNFFLLATQLFFAMLTNGIKFKRLIDFHFCKRIQTRSTFIPTKKESMVKASKWDWNKFTSLNSRWSQFSQIIEKVVNANWNQIVSQTNHE